MPFPPHFDSDATQHFLALEVLGGVMLICLDGLREGFFPGPKTYVPFLFTFGMLSIAGMVPGLGGTTVIVGGIVLAVLLIQPDAQNLDTLGGAIFHSASDAASNIGKAGPTRSIGHS